MRSRQVIKHFVEMCYKRKQGNATSGNYKAFRDGADNLPCLTLFRNKIAWQETAESDIETSNRGWNTQTTRRTLNCLDFYRTQVRASIRQRDVFDESF